jgi:hypothetical protein
MHVGAVAAGTGSAAPEPLRTEAVHGPGRAGTHPASAPPNIAQSAAPVSDTVASLLSSAKIGDLLASIDQRRPIQSPEVIAELTRAAISAVEEQDFVRALEKLRELVAMDPERADSMPSDPAFDPIRAELNQLLRELAAAAQAEAEQKLGTAHEALESDGARLPEGDKADLRSILSVAAELVQTERHANYVRAGELAEVVMVQCGWTPAGVPVWAPSEVQAPVRAPGPWENLWQKGPLPILLLAWLALGIVGALPFTVLHIGWPIAAFALCLWGGGLVAFVRWYRRARRRREREAAFSGSGGGHAQSDVVIETSGELGR